MILFLLQNRLSDDITLYKSVCLVLLLNRCSTQFYSIHRDIFKDDFFNAIILGSTTSNHQDIDQIILAAVQKLWHATT